MASGFCVCVGLRAGVLELRYLKEFITADKDGCIRPSMIKEPSNADFAIIERTLDMVSVRNTLHAHAQLSACVHVYLHACNIRMHAKAPCMHANAARVTILRADRRGGVAQIHNKPRISVNARIHLHAPAWFCCQLHAKLAFGVQLGPVCLLATAVLQVRPSKGPKTLVLALEFKACGALLIQFMMSLPDERLFCSLIYIHAWTHAYSVGLVHPL